MICCFPSLGPRGVPAAVSLSCAKRNRGLQSGGLSPLPFTKAGDGGALTLPSKRLLDGTAASPATVRWGPEVARGSRASRRARRELQDARRSRAGTRGGRRGALCGRGGPGAGLLASSPTPSRSAPHPRSPPPGSATFRGDRDDPALRNAKQKQLAMAEERRPRRRRGRNPAGRGLRGARRFGFRFRFYFLARSETKRN